MTPRERWLAVLNGEKPDRIPTDFWSTPEVRDRLKKQLSCPTDEDLWQKLHIDRPAVIGAPHRTERHKVDPEANIWGIRKKTVQYGTGSYDEAVNHPLADVSSVDDVHAFAWPDAEEHDWDAFQQQIDQLDGRRVVVCGTYEPYLLYCQMRGMEQAMMDLLVEKDIAHAIMDHLFDFHYQRNVRLWEMADGKADITIVAEDLGSQSSLLMGLDQIREFILPRQKKMADKARQFGLKIFYHTDGAAYDVIPDLIEVTGIDILNPIQWRCPGMERDRLVRDFGGKVVFHGAVDNQQTLAFGTADDVRNEVLDNIEIFAPAQWICAPCHNIQPVSPTENIVTMYETIHEHGKLA
jgi:uroporphyrinogen decarboxylase